MKLHSIVLIVCTFAIAGLICLVIFINQRESLVVDGSIQLPGLQKPVQICFDKAYVPYIQARSEKDLIIAQGFITASERLFQMDILRRLSKGEMAAIFGSSCLASDRLARILGFKRLADQEYAGLSLETKKWLRGYCQGINAYIAQYNEKLPLEFVLLGYQPQPWRAEDTLAILRYLQYANDECWQLKILQDSVREKAGDKLTAQMFGQWGVRAHLPQTSFVPDSGIEMRDLHLPEMAMALPSPAEPTWGSNGWVVSKKLSQSGASMLACDKHTLAVFPDLFFACSLRAPFVHVAGLTIPGVPGILIGRNDEISWAPISLKGCWQNLNIERFSEKDPDQYIGPGGWLKADEIEEEIPQRFSTSRIEKVFITRHGPLLTKADKTAVSLSWYGFNPRNNVVDSIWPLNKAKNWTEFQSALKNYKGSPQTFLYADGTGKIGKQIAGHIQFTDIDNQDLAGQQNYIVANEEVSSALIAPGNLGLLSNNDAALRARNILVNRQRTAATISLEDMIAVQADTKAPLSELMVSALRNALRETKCQDKFQQEAFTLLAHWDGQLKANSACASIYELFLSEFTREMLQVKLGRQLSEDYINKWPRWTQFAKWGIENRSAQLLPPAEHSFAGFLLNCFSQSLKNMRLAFNVNQLHMNMFGCQWQKLHQLDFQSNINKFIPSIITNIVSAFLPGSIGVGGDLDCLNACNNMLPRNRLNISAIPRQLPGCSLTWQTMTSFIKVLPLDSVDTYFQRIE